MEGLKRESNESCKRSGFAAAHGGKASPFRVAPQNLLGAMPQKLRRSLKRINQSPR